MDETEIMFSVVYNTSGMFTCKVIHCETKESGCSLHRSVMPLIVIGRNDNFLIDLNSNKTN